MKIPRVLISLVEQLDQAGIDHRICGGQAAVFYGLREEAGDWDIAVEQITPELTQILKQAGLTEIPDSNGLSWEGPVLIDLIIANGKEYPTLTELGLHVADFNLKFPKRSMMGYINWKNGESAYQHLKDYKTRLEDARLPAAVSDYTDLERFKALESSIKKLKSLSASSSDFSNQETAMSELDRANPIPGGVGDDLSLESVDVAEFLQGVETEMEHVKNSDVPKEQQQQVAADITFDHLKEIDDYYSRLTQMEQQAKEETMSKAAFTESSVKVASDSVSPQVSLMYQNEPGVERAMRDAEEQVFGKGLVAMYGQYHGGGASDLVVWWYPGKYEPQVKEMHRLLAEKGLNKFRVADENGRIVPFIEGVHDQKALATLTGALLRLANKLDDSGAVIEASLIDRVISEDNLVFAQALVAPASSPTEKPTAPTPEVNWQGQANDYRKQFLIDKILDKATGVAPATIRYYKTIAKVVHSLAHLLDAVEGLDHHSQKYIETVRYVQDKYNTIYDPYNTDYVPHKLRFVRELLKIVGLVENNIDKAMKPELGSEAIIEAFVDQLKEKGYVSELNKLKKLID